MTTMSGMRTLSASGAARGIGLRDRVARKLLLRAMTRIEEGSLTLDGVGGRVVAGDRSDDGPHAAATVLDGRTYRDVAFGGSLGAGESYMRGWWTTDDLTSFVRLMLRNREALEQLDGLWRRALGPAQRMRYWLERNTRAGSRRNIAAHYDLSNEFFALWLDSTMCYSSGVFAHEGATLEEASIEKMDRLCRGIGLNAEHHLLEIGCGWGGLAMHAARRYGCRVTATTISRAQAEWARRRIAEEGLEDRITIVEQDYRDLRGSFDRVVSIEMIEAVGAERLNDYFACCSRLLKPDGQMALQAIVIRDQFFERAARTRDWLKAYVFPGSCLPSMNAMSTAVQNSTDMTIVRVEDFASHYVRTLRLWRERFFDQAGEIRQLGFGDMFMRMWEFYLCYCEGAFRERQVSLVQMTLAKPRWRDEIGGEGRGA